MLSFTSFATTVRNTGRSCGRSTFSRILLFAGFAFAFLLATHPASAQRVIIQQCPGCVDPGGGGVGGGGGLAYPTFNGGQQYTNPTLYGSGQAISTDNYSPSTVSCDNALWLAYTDANGNIQLYVSPDAVNFDGPLQTFQNSFYQTPAGTTLALGCLNNQLYFAYNLVGQIQYLIYDLPSGGVVAAGTYPNVSGMIGQPALTTINGTLYLAYVINASGYNGLTYPQVFTSVWNGLSNPATGFYGNDVYYPVVSGTNPSLASLNGSLAIVWLTGSGQNNPVVVVPPVGQTSATAISQINETSGIMIGSSPAAVNFNNVLYIFGRSYYSEDNLWAIATSDGVNFANENEFGQSLRGIPSMTVFNGTLVEAERGNYNNDLWVYLATY
jgi:hypothetical protein